MTEEFGGFTIETTKVSRRETKHTVRQGENVICWLEQRGSRIEQRHIIPEYRDQFREFLRQWRTVNGNKFPFNY